MRAGISKSGIRQEGVKISRSSDTNGRRAERLTSSLYQQRLTQSCLHRECDGD